MKRAEHIEKELNELGAKILIDLPSTMPYSVPIQFFGNFAGEIIDIIKVTDSPELHPSWNVKLPYSLPDPSYFKGLSAQILGKINKDLELSKENPYSLPTGYFDSLPDIILTKTKAENSKKRKRVPLFRTLQLAASVALFVFTGFAVLKLNSVKTTTSSVSLSASDAEIKNYVNENLDDFDTDLIINTLASTNTNKDNKIDISDEEIKDYLDNNGWN